MKPRKIDQVFREFKEMIEEDTRSYLLFSSMFEQLPNKKPSSQDLEGHKELRDVDHMLLGLNHIMTAAPKSQWERHWTGLYHYYGHKGDDLLEADNENIGLMCVLLVGMVEVSTNEITVKECVNMKTRENSLGW